MAGITISVGASELLSESAFLRLEEAVTNTQPLMDQLGELLVRSASRRIGISNVGPDGKPWLPSKRAQAVGGRTLLQRGTLQSSITHRATADGVEWGSNVVYSAVHQLGAAAGAFGIWEGVVKGRGTRTLSLPFGDIPARPYLGVSAEDREDISELVLSYFSDAVGGGQ